MQDFSEQHIKENCPHCDPNSFALKHPLEETDNFWVVCDVHPLTKGHILIIPKSHLSCIGEYPDDIFAKFQTLYTRFSEFLFKQYGSISTFEHGKISQTVFHSHVHLLPFKGNPLQIVTEGEEKLQKLDNLSDLKNVYNKDGAYLFLSIDNKMWIVNIAIAAPRFFRDRFAIALGNKERGNWKEMHANKKLMKAANHDIIELEHKWQKFKDYHEVS